MEMKNLMKVNFIIFIIESCPIAIIVFKYCYYKKFINQNPQNSNNLNNNELLKEA